MVYWLSNDIKIITLDDIQGQWQQIRSAIPAAAGLIVLQLIQSGVRLNANKL